MKKHLFFYTLLLLLFFSCEKGEIYKYKAEKNLTNFSFYGGTIYYGEVIQIRYNDELIFLHKMDSVPGYPHSFQCYKEFNLPYTEKFSISITTKYKNKTYIDTTIIANKGDFGYHLTLSRSVPFNWYNDYFDVGKIEPRKAWGYMPIDSSIRIISFKADTIYKNTWTDIVN